jgi:hypothetical protein
MRKLTLLLAALFLAALPAKAQSSYPSTEIFGGYSYLSSEFLERENLHGFGVSFAGNLSENWGFVAETSFHFGKTTIEDPFFGQIDLDFKKYLFLFGPRFSKRSDAATAFAHVLVGGAKAKVEDVSGNTRFALAVGGGVDINAGKNFALRAFQIDYIPERSTGQWTQNFRAQVGIVFKFGQ